MHCNSCVIGSGSYLPQKILTNDDLSKIMDTSDEWIFKRTGIRARHIADENEYTSDLAVNAAKNAISAAKISSDEIDLIICATVTPDLTFPSTAVIVQKKLGIKNCIAFDITAACSGFVFALSVADNFIKSGSIKNALVIGAECFSRILNWNDRGTSVLFGDGAGAFVLSRTENLSEGILYKNIGSDGTYVDILKTSGGISKTKTAGFVEMDGKEVFKFATSKMTFLAKEVMENFHVDYVIPHQANIRIIDMIAGNLDISKDKFIISIENQANTSAASIPLAFDSFIKSGNDFSGKNVMFLSIGAGMTWGSMLIKM